ncbi:MAG: hypothetical protein IPJ02_08480 [Chitinophagaceae bacterium]|nr:hypothetical protein [Chitinophagaceae bacterium]
MNKKPNEKTTNANRSGNCTYVNQSPAFFWLIKKYAEKSKEGYSKTLAVVVKGNSLQSIVGGMMCL